MAEENRDETDGTEQPKKRPFWKLILAVIVTTLCVMIIFFGTCLSLMGEGTQLLQIYTALFSVFCFIRAARTRKKGVRAAFLVLGVLGWIVFRFLL